MLVCASRANELSPASARSDLREDCFRETRIPTRGTRALPGGRFRAPAICRFSRQSVRAGREGLSFLVSEETAAANDLGDLRRHHLVPAFVSGGDALEHVACKYRQILRIIVMELQEAAATD